MAGSTDVVEQPDHEDGVLGEAGPTGEAPDAAADAPGEADAGDDAFAEESYPSTRLGETSAAAAG